MAFGYPEIQRFGINKAGRDFVVGDIHGAYDLVLAAMREAKFDPDKDRLFAVGDLIDRGRGSHRCAGFLKQPYVHALRGNHEDFLLYIYKDGEPDEEILPAVCQFNGLKWWLDVGKEQRREILEELRKLPLAMEIETPRGTVGLIHADVPAGMEWKQFLSLLEAGDEKTVETCLSGRKRIKSRDEAGVPGIGRVFVGHSIQWNGVARYGNVYAIDTGAVFGNEESNEPGHLTMAHIAMNTRTLVAAKNSAFQLIDLRDESFIPETPFGSSSGMPERAGRRLLR